MECAHVLHERYVIGIFAGNDNRLSLLHTSNIQIGIAMIFFLSRVSAFYSVFLLVIFFFVFKETCRLSVETLTIVVGFAE